MDDGRALTITLTPTLLILDLEHQQKFETDAPSMFDLCLPSEPWAPSDAPSMRGTCQQCDDTASKPQEEQSKDIARIMFQQMPH